MVELKSLAFAALVVFGQIGTIAQAQVASDIRFAPGNYGTMISGAVMGDGYVDYRLGANAGQQLVADLKVMNSTGNGTVYFNILPPGSVGYASYNASIDGNTTTVVLPESGTYTIRVYQMGNDRDTNQTSGFTIDLSIQ